MSNGPFTSGCKWPTLTVYNGNTVMLYVGPGPNDVRLSTLMSDISRNMLEDACNKIRALTAFLWIGWIVASVIMAYTLYRAFKQSHLRSVSRGCFVSPSELFPPSLHFNTLHNHPTTHNVNLIRPVRYSPDGKRFNDGADYSCGPASSAMVAI